MKKYICWDDRVFYSVNVVKYLMLFHFDWDTFHIWLPCSCGSWESSWCVPLLSVAASQSPSWAFLAYIHSFKSDSSKVPNWVLYKSVKISNSVSSLIPCFCGSINSNMLNLEIYGNSLASPVVSGLILVMELRSHKLHGTAPPGAAPLPQLYPPEAQPLH